MGLWSLIPYGHTPAHRKQLGRYLASQLPPVILLVIVSARNAVAVQAVALDGL